jgi:hypothetical protein
MPAQHTPGPWQAIDERPQGLERIVILGPPDARSKHRHGRCHIVEMRGWNEKPGQTAEEVLADARLIAAAPELLAALKVARELLDRNDIRRPEIDAAIAKAEGR